MTNDYRTEAEKFVTAFLDYIKSYDILDKFDKRNQKMVRSPGVESLIKQAESVFPDRLEGPAIQEANKRTCATQEEFNSAIEDSNNVIDTREVFARKTQANGGVRAMLRAIIEGREDADEAVERAKEFFAAEDGKREFALPPKI